MKTHRAAFESSFFATAGLWMSINRDRPEYRTIAMQAEVAAQLLGLSLAKLVTISEGQDYQQVLLKGTDELNHLSLEIKMRHDSIHSQCFRVGMHCGNLFGAATCGKDVPGIENVLLSYFRNIDNEVKALLEPPSPAHEILSLSPQSISFNTLIPLVEKLAKWFESYSKPLELFYFISYSRVDNDFVCSLEAIIKEYNVQYFLDVRDIADVVLILP